MAVRLRHRSSVESAIDAADLNFFFVVFVDSTTKKELVGKERGAFLITDERGIELRERRRRENAKECNLFFCFLCGRNQFEAPNETEARAWSAQSPIINMSRVLLTRLFLFRVRVIAECADVSSARLGNTLFGRNAQVKAALLPLSFSFLCSGRSGNAEVLTVGCVDGGDNLRIEIAV